MGFWASSAKGNSGSITFHFKNKVSKILATQSHSCYVTVRVEVKDRFAGSMTAPLAM
jgi:hypothetical protein